MGYYMNQRSASFRIPASAVPLALAAIKSLADKPEQMGGGSSDGERWYSWVTTSEFVDAKDFKEAMAAWRWSVATDDDGNVVDICFDGDKLGDDEILLGAIAPFVEAGSYIEMSGEDGSFWKWTFDGKELDEIYGKVVYE